jgi:hypothetical protein
MDNIEPIETLVQGSSMTEFLVRFLLNFVAIFTIVRLIYYPRYRNKDFLFTFFLFNIINFLICFLLSTAKLKIGFAFGLFAIFSILRYRTVTVPVREMGYFFISVTLGIINALASMENYMVQLFIANGLVLALTYVLDNRISLQHENFKEIVYERIDLIHPDKRNEMLADIRARTGLDVHRVEFIKIDFLKDVAFIHAFYFSQLNDAPSYGITRDEDD